MPHRLTLSSTLTYLFNCGRVPACIVVFVNQLCSDALHKVLRDVAHVVEDSKVLLQYLGQRQLPCFPYMSENNLLGGRRSPAGALIISYIAQQDWSINYWYQIASSTAIT